MRYLDQKMKEVAEMLRSLQADTDIVYDDIHSGNEMQMLANHLKITSNDTIISSSLDGAQLYQNKKSDTWISIWILDISKTANLLVHLFHLFTLNCTYSAFNKLIFFFYLFSA